jgi:hypothetical protein
MTVRGLGLLSLVVALAIAGWLFAQQTKDVGPTSPAATHVESQASGEVAATNFASAVPDVEAYHAENGTYAGVTLSPGYQLTVVRADDAGYCLQGGTGAGVQHLAGPGGSPAPGPC